VRRLEQGRREETEVGGKAARAGFWRTITLDFTAEMEFTEAKNSERRKTEVKRRYIAANDDDAGIKLITESAFFSSCGA